MMRQVDEMVDEDMQGMDDYGVSGVYLPLSILDPCFQRSHFCSDFGTNNCQFYFKSLF